MAILMSMLRFTRWNRKLCLVGSVLEDDNDTIACTGKSRLGKSLL